MATATQTIRILLDLGERSAANTALLPIRRLPSACRASPESRQEKSPRCGPDRPVELMPCRPID